MLKKKLKNNLNQTFNSIHALTLIFSGSWQFLNRPLNVIQQALVGEWACRTIIGYLYLFYFF